MNIKCEDAIEYDDKGISNTIAYPLGKNTKIFQYDNKQETDSNYFENFYYPIGIQRLFPLDFNYQKVGKFRPECWLRPEIIAEYREEM